MAQEATDSMLNSEEGEDCTEGGSGTMAKAPARNNKVVIIAAAIVAVALVAGLAFLLTRPPAGAAAKLNDSYIDEARVTQWIQDYRTNYSLTDDDDFASFLTYYSETPEQFRESVINELAIEDLVEARAKELGIEVTQSEVDAYYDKIKGDNDTSDGSLWASVLEEAGLTEDILKERYRYNILQDKVLATDVEMRDATDDEVVSYAKDSLSGSTQIHVCHIVLSGDDAKARADECYAKLDEARKSGNLDAETFASFAKEYSDEQDAETTGGAVGWTGSGLISDEVIDALYNEDDEELNIAVGTLLGPLESSDGSYEIAYIDENFQFPSSEDVSDLESIGMPEELLAAVRYAVSQSVWSDACSEHLLKMLEDATLVVYSMPNDVPYNVKMS